MNLYRLLLISVLVLLVAACAQQGLQAGAQAEAAQLTAVIADNLATQQALPSPTSTATATATTQPTAAPSATPAPTNSPSPTVTPSLIAKPVQKDPLVLVLAEGVEIPLVRVPAGEFLMGSGPEDTFAEKDEKPQHTVYLDEYLIGKTEVTVSQYRLFLQAAGYAGDPRSLNSKDNYPVTYVTWDDAVAFCDWLSEWTGQKVTLPTEAQWEKAARGTDGRIYPWGNQSADCTLANYFDSVNGYCVSDNTLEGTAAASPVGSYPAGASPYGVLDMAGNAWEWVNDLYQADYYTSSPEGNPSGPTKGMYQSLRGGDWDRAPYVRVADRSFKMTSDVQPWVGFRVAVAP